MISLMIVNLGLALLDALLAVALGVVYWRNHREIRSPFTAALLLFAAFLLVHNAIIAYHYLTMMGTFGGIGERFLFAESLLQTAAVGALLYATMR